MAKDADDRMTMPGGYYVNNTTGARTSLKLYGLVVLADAVFTAYSVDGTSEFTNYNLSGITIPKGTELFAPEDSQITAYTLASGTVLELKEFK